MNHINHLYCTINHVILDVLKIFDNAPQFGLPSGIALVIEGEGNRLIGTVTEGDIRRAILKNRNLDVPVNSIMQNDPIYFHESLSITEILEAMPHELLKRKRKSSKYLSKIVLIDINHKPVRVLDYHQLWEQKVASHRHLVVVGLGYVGLTMAVVMADAGFLVTGVDIDESKLQVLRQGESYIHEVGLPELIKEHIFKNLQLNSNIPEDGDVYIISVGTPVEVNEDGKKRPVMKYLLDACVKIATHLKRGNLVILRSTVPIGTCRNFVIPMLEEHSGLTCGQDFHLSFAPERTAEGKALKELRSLPQIIGGFNRDSLEATSAIFRDVTPTIVKVESLEAAEMAKLINNSFRDYIFAYSNQMAKIAALYNINVVNIIQAANEGYPRDTVPLPSPGVGGPCLTKDPYIFASVAETHHFDDDIFIRGRYINESMHELVFEGVMKQLQQTGKNPQNCKILICGLAFKGTPETGDIRNSSGVEIAKRFLGNVANVYGYDPVALRNEIEETGLIPINSLEQSQGMDAVLFLNNHKSFEKINVFEFVRSLNENPVIYDGWNLFRGEDFLSTRECIFMGLSFIKTSIK